MQPSDTERLTGDTNALTGYVLRSWHSARPTHVSPDDSPVTIYTTKRCGIDAQPHALPTAYAPIRGPDNAISLNVLPPWGTTFSRSIPLHSGAQKLVHVDVAGDGARAKRETTVKTRTLKDRAASRERQMATQTGEDAASRLDTHIEEIEDALTEIRKHARGFLRVERDQVHWGHVGDAARLRSDLIDILEYLRSNDK